MPFGLAAALYGMAAFVGYQEENLARSPASTLVKAGAPPPRHPEANLRRIRESFADGEYTDALLPYLERAAVEAPASYQAPFLLAAFYANRLENPERVRLGFEYALERFPANGRLHLTYAQWLLTPRPTAPYRRYRRAPDEDFDARRRALEQIARATELEPDLTARALRLLQRFDVPPETWRSVLPKSELTMRLILDALSRRPHATALRRAMLERILSQTQDRATLQRLRHYAREWDETALALEAAERWYRLDRESPSADLVQAALGLAEIHLEQNRLDDAYRLLRETLTELENRGLSQEGVRLLVAMGDLYSTKGRLTMAQSLYAEALTLSPYDDRARLGLARVYRRSGNDEAAVRELESILELLPGHEAARAELDAIRSQTPRSRRP